MGTEQITEAAATARVEALARELSRRGFATTVTTVNGQHQPCLRVVNKQAPRMWEDVYAAPDFGGQWSFWWSWAAKIGPINDITAAATALACKLGVDSGPPA